MGFKLDGVEFTSQEIQGITLLLYTIILLSDFHQFLESHRHQMVYPYVLRTCPVLGMTPHDQNLGKSLISFENNSDQTPFLYFLHIYSNSSLCLKSHFSYLFQGRVRVCSAKELFLVPSFLAFFP